MTTKAICLSLKLNCAILQVRPTLTEDMTPGDIDKMFKNPRTKTDKEELQPLPMVSLIDFSHLSQ